MQAVWDHNPPALSIRCAVILTPHLHLTEGRVSGVCQVTYMEASYELALRQKLLLLVICHYYWSNLLKVI